MAERWQQWMPFHIDKFRGSPEVQAMHPTARCGYIYLLASAWQSADCSLSADVLDLATESGLGDELWALHGLRISRKFRVREDGRLVNDVLLREWSEAKSMFEHNTKVRSEAGRIGNAIRWGRKCDTDATKTVAKTSQNIATGTGTGTTTEVLSTLAQTSQSESTPDRGKALGTIPCNGKVKQFTFYEADVGEWQESFPGIDVLQQLRQCRQWNLDNHVKRKTARGMRKFINSWLSRAQDASGGSNGTHQRHSDPTTERQRRIDDETRASIARLTGFSVGGAVGS